MELDTTNAAYIQVNSRLDFFIEANNLNLYQTTPPKQQSDSVPYSLQYRMPTSVSRRDGQKTKLVTGIVRVILRSSWFTVIDLFNCLPTIGVCC